MWLGIDWSQGGSSTGEKSKDFILFLLQQVLDRDKEKMPKLEESKSKSGRLLGLVMARGRCWTGAWKRALEITGFLVDQGIKDQTFWEL